MANPNPHDKQGMPGGHVPGRRRSSPPPKPTRSADGDMIHGPGARADIGRISSSNTGPIMNNRHDTEKSFGGG